MVRRFDMELMIASSGLEGALEFTRQLQNATQYAITRLEPFPNAGPGSSSNTVPLRSPQTLQPRARTLHTVFITKCAHKGV